MASRGDNEGEGETEGDGDAEGEGEGEGAETPALPTTSSPVMQFAGLQCRRHDGLAASATPLLLSPLRCPEVFLVMVVTLPRMTRRRAASQAETGLDPAALLALRHS